MQTTRKLKESVLKEDQVTEDLNENIMSRVKRHGDRLGDNIQKRTAFGDITNDKLNIVIDTTLKNQKGKTGVKAFIKSQYTTATSQLPLVHKNVVAKDKSKKTTMTKKKPHGEIDVLTQVLSPSQETVVSSSQSSTTSEDSSLLVPSPQDSPSQGLQTCLYDDIDAEHTGDIAQVALYAKDIFEYYKQREGQFSIAPYITKQTELTPAMRTILVDWLVEVQENFELNHETLYLAVKLVDTYLSRKKISKELLQLIGATALFVACKFDERCPPLVQDFLYICDDAYKRKEFLHMEMSILKTIDFDLGIPLSYRFLRRYAKCHRAPVELLTLARYILELSLMEYSMVPVRDSKMAAATLYIAMRMKHAGDWTPTLVHYTGYKKAELLPLARSLNKMVVQAPLTPHQTIYSKYSHEVFHKVAAIPVIANEELCS